MRSKTYDVSRPIPAEIIAEGDDAIRAYADTTVNDEIARQKAVDQARDEHVKNSHVGVEAEYDGAQLTGRIVWAEHSTLVVRLDAPRQGELRLQFGFVSAVAGHRIFDMSSAISPYAIETAQGMLIEIYRRERHQSAHRDVIELAERLNGQDA